MDLDESKKELKKQMESQGYATLDEKTIPAIEAIVASAIARQDGHEVMAGPVPAYADGVEPYEDLGGNCPVQGTGWFTAADNKQQFAYYFRARGTMWSVEVADGPEHLYEGEPMRGPKWQVVGFYGKGPYDAGWMPRAHAMHCLNSAYKAWLAAGGHAAQAGEFEMLPDFVTPVAIK